MARVGHGRNVRAVVSTTIQMSEAQLQSAVIELARLLQWRVAHFRPAETEKGWRTPVEADGKGFPDLCMARNGEVIFAEIKDAKRGLASDQLSWQYALEPPERASHSYYVWRPAQWLDGTIEARLR